jgi:hypothetical protein
MMAKQPFTKKQQKKIGYKGVAKQYDVGYRDTPASEAVLRNRKKLQAKKILKGLMGN